MDNTPPGSNASAAAQGNALAAKSAKRTTGNAIIVSQRQKGNPILEHVRNVPWEYGDILADYQVGSTTGLGRNYDLRILLILCDVTEHQNSIKELTKACLLNNITVMVSWSPEEAGQYLATYKLYEFKSHQLIKERIDADYSSVLRAALTTVRGVNKTDVMTLRTNFGSFTNIAHATTEDLQLCPGFGPTKVRRLREAFNKPFHSSWQKSFSGKDLVQPANQDITHEPGPAGWPEVEEPDIREPRAPPVASPIPPIARSAARHSSPEWDIDILRTQDRPDADLLLELELNPSDEEVGTRITRDDANIAISPKEDRVPSSKKRRAND
ncbi:hypothetical protein BDV93DRAFT_190375 [Ceratobasidium sp. AG-I]|nr:hypothetical protein BDV93DRAFT_190375 [Ceratobasidium sp. AG-I]